MSHDVDSTTADWVTGVAQSVNVGSRVVDGPGGSGSKKGVWVSESGDGGDIVLCGVAELEAVNNHDSCWFD